MTKKQYVYLVNIYQFNDGETDSFVFRDYKNANKFIKAKRIAMENQDYAEILVEKVELQ